MGLFSLSVFALLGACDPEENVVGGEGGAELEAGAAGDQCTNPETGEADTTVECLTDPCSTATCAGDPDATCEADYCGGCHAVFTAEDGSSAECDGVACPADAMLCPDGSYVSRDPERDCAFEPCPELTACDADAMVCPDGSSVGRDPADDCQFRACPGEDDDDSTVCATDVRECEDGSYVSRDPASDCEFELCDGECRNPVTGEPDTQVECLVDPCSVNTCDAHPDADCTADYCGGCHAIFRNEAGQALSCELMACTLDAKQCPDGTWVGRDGSNDCEWLPCP